MQTIKKSPVWLLLCYLFIFSTSAQTVNKITPLKVGDQCPDLLFDHIINSKTPSAKLSDFKGKLVILDFWATWCGACIAGLPKLDTLQKKFRNDIVILPVTSQPTVSVADFIKQNNILKGLHLPYITQDSTLRKYFPFRIMGQKVWIDGDGKIVAITDHLQVTETNVNKALKQDYAVIKQKTPDILVMNGKKPLYSGFWGDTYKLDENLIQYQSILTGNIDGAADRNTGPIVENGKILRTIVNWWIIHLYSIALVKEKKMVYQYQGDYSERLSSRTHLEVRDSSRFYLPSFSKKQKEAYKKLPDSLNCFTYQQIVPLKDSLLANDYMLEDLNRYFGRKFGIEGLLAVRKVKCWALTRIDKTDIKSKSNSATAETWGRNKDYVKLHNYPFKRWFKYMLMYYLEQSPIPIVNESGYQDDKVDMEITANLENVDSLNEALKKYGLKFKLVERELEMRVIRDKK